MKFLAWWIVFQLIILGVGGAKIERAIQDENLDCNITSRKTPIIVGILVPLREFTNTITADNVRDYCTNKETK